MFICTSDMCISIPYISICLYVLAHKQPSPLPQFPALYEHEDILFALISTRTHKHVHLSTKIRTRSVRAALSRLFP